MARKGPRETPPWHSRIVGYDTVLTDSLLANPRNWRIHPQAQQDALTGVLHGVGIVQNLVINKRTSALWPPGDRYVETLCDGHLRVTLALREGQATLPVTYVDLTPDEENLVLATFDPIAALAGVDAPQLSDLLHETTTSDATLMAFLSALAEEHGIVPPDAQGPVGEVEPEIDRAEVLRAQYGVTVGQLWGCGEHRILCGDCTDEKCVARLMQGQQTTLVITDPPYGVSYADKNVFLNTIDCAYRIETPIANDHVSKIEIQEIWKTSFTYMVSVMAPGAVVYCFMPQGGDQMKMMMMMERAGIEPRHELIWVKNNPVLGRVDYAYKHEPILYAWKKGGHHFYGDFQTSLLEYPKPQRSDLHPTMKPVPLIMRLIENSSRRDEVVYDPFLGAGATLIAAQQLGRVCRGIELSPDYVAVSMHRWAQLTGTAPVLLEAGSQEHSGA